MELLKSYREIFFKDNFIEKIREKNNDYLQEVLKRSEYLLNGHIVYTDAMDMETCFTPYRINDYKWKHTPNNDEEWCFMLNRQGFTLDLALSYILTNEEKYLLKWKELVFSFIKEEGEPNSQNKLCWRPLDAGLRLGFWVRSLVYIGKDKFTSLEWKELLNSIEVHKKYLQESFVNKYLLSNWGVLALSGVILSTLFEKNSIKKYEDIWKKLETTIELQFTKSGVQWEQSPLYHHEVILNYAYILQVSEILSIKLPINLRERLETFVKSAYYMCDQKDNLLALNDSDYVDFSYVYDFYRGMGLLNDRDQEQLRKLKSEILLGNYYLEKLSNYEGKKYSENFFDNVGGLAVVKDKDYYFTCFNGLHGSSHGQSSQGAMTFTYKGEPILIDCGRYSYTECEERITLNKDISHNTTTFKNLKGTVIKNSWEYESLLEPLGMDMKNEKDFSYVEMLWLSKNKADMAIFRRNVFLFKDIKTLVIVDDVKTNHNDDLEVYFHLDKKYDVKLENNILKTENIMVYSDGNIETFDFYHSPRYNKLENHTVVKIKNNNFSTTVISLEKELEVVNIPVYQNNQSKEFESCKGIKLNLLDKTKEIYVNSQEIVKHDKLLVGDNNHLFYGNVVIFENNNRIRVK